MEQEESVMKKAFAILVIVAALSLFIQLQPAFAAYDSAAAKAAMQKVAQHMKDLQANVAAKDYYGAAEKFMDVARDFKELAVINPIKGDKETWNRIHGNLINAAFKGIGACGAQDDAGIKQAIQDLIKYRNEGHKIFN
jgi:hypothetical protein